MKGGIKISKIKQYFKKFKDKAVKISKQFYELIKKCIFRFLESHKIDLSKVKKNTLEFYRKNPIYFVCSLIYYVLASLWLGGTIFSFIIVLFFYAVSIIVVFSPLGEKLLRLLNRVRRLETNQEKEYLRPIFEEVYTEAKAKNPELGHIEICVIDQMTVNACAMGKHTIGVTKGAMETFTEDQLKAVLAHEIAHILNLDTIAILYTIVGNGIFTVFVVISKFFLNLVDIVGEAFTQKGIVRFFCALTRFMFNALVFVLMFFMQVVIAINSRKNEFRADNYAYAIGYGSEMIDSLYLLEKINLGDNSTIIQKMIASHPRITQRIERLEMLTEKENNID